jgi:hypothetical protein
MTHEVHEWIQGKASAKKPCIPEECRASSMSLSFS